ncbi:NADPH:quinone reductase-like Zn-dependent oxidoreductase [Streptococcus gallinaceus]|uniref:NADP-dependent oxidoreductase n=1 Tax=Streptococcus gallinaceus TaxID=165758 RepID=UPI00209D7431|nr:NADP-dependent oxidoreductase [Streptococcus gallinaceus]MCP1640157.1 NADPH:quinone reductase-like Zn-dependent oxidoreductase [Streptococcus gallinaceus]MCP1770939.1 NADPH:quinone reductase-like Zn-dependent oxidoreductase [Streptococcus gallinaceus]
MKAIQQIKYAKEPFDLEIVDIPKPTISSQDVLIKVVAAGLNSVDYKLMTGSIRAIFPFKTPFTAGNEFAGGIEEVGSDVVDFKVGDRIYGRMTLKEPGAFAAYVGIAASEIALIPDYLSFEEAAGIPLTALTAYQALDLLKVEAGKTIFISGGTGGFGAIAIPLAKARGLRVVTNGRAIHKERMLSLGVDQFIDYQTEDYTAILSDVDYVIDTLGGEELEKQFGILKTGGHLVSLSSLPNRAFAKEMGLSWFKQFLFGLVGRKYDKLAAENGQTYHFIFMHSDGPQLREISRIFAEKQVPISSDQVFAFTDINKALDKLRKGGSKGKSILRVEE